ncbi:cation diffusion facilitator family transporter [Porphyromonadaceae bacterium]
MDDSIKEMRERKQDIFRITIIGAVVNLLLVALKLVAGVVGRSGAMLADAVHSLSDLISDAVVLLFVNLSSKPIDDDHPYGHGKFETLATTIISLMLMAVGGGLLWEGGSKIWGAMHGELLDKPDYIALYAAIISILSKEILYQYTIIVGKRINSPSVIANAWHHRSDAFSSIGTGLGIGGAIMLGDSWRILDPIAACIVSLFILKIAVKMLIPGIDELLERALPTDKQKEICSAILATKGVESMHKLRTRSIGTRIAIEVHVCVNPTMTVTDAHDISIQIKRELRSIYGAETHIAIHVEPVKEKE